MNTTVRIIPQTPKTPKNESAVRTLKEALKMAEDNIDTSNVMVLIKINGDYIRFSTSLDAPVEVIGQLELSKTDVVLQMTGLIDTPP